MSRQRKLKHRAKQAVLPWLIESQNGLCALCSFAFSPHDPATIDHVIPVVNWPAGERLESNMQAAHASCNNLRGSLSMTQWVAAIRSGRVKLADTSRLSEAPNLDDVWRGDRRFESRQQTICRLRREVTLALADQ